MSTCVDDAVGTVGATYHAMFCCAATLRYSRDRAVVTVLTCT